MTRRRRSIIIGGAVVLVLGLAGGGARLWITSDGYEIWKLHRELARADVKDQPKVLWQLGSIRDPRVADIAADVLQTAQDPHVREAAAYVVQKVGVADRFELLRRSAVAEPPAEVQAKMAIYVARLGGDRAKSWLDETSEGPSSWLGLGSALGRIEVGDVSADRIVFEYLTGPDKAMRAFAAVRVAGWIATMAEVIGRPAPLPDKPEYGITPEQGGQMVHWWRRYVTSDLLGDNVVWDKRGDPMWRRARRLMHARRDAIDYLGID